MNRRIALLLLGLALWPTACTLPGAPAPAPPPGGEAAPPPGNSWILVTADPSRATPTPFLPLDPTAPVEPPTPVPTPAWGGFPGPTVPPAIAIPPPMGLFAQPAGQVNFLLLGSDQRPNEGGFRTDTILLVTLNPNLGTANVTSFPRDLYVYIPGWTMQRINTAHPHGGFALTQATFEYNLGVRPDHFVLMNFWGFQQMVDNLGGINVSVAAPLTDHRDGYGSYYVPPGVVHMDGETALWYVRARYATGDFDRARRQQEVLLALFYRLISLDGIRRAPELYALYSQNVITDMTFQDGAPLLGLAAELANNPANIGRYFIGREQVTSYTTSGGAAVLLPIQERVREVMRGALNVP